MEHLKMKSPDIVSENMAYIAERWPECLTEAKDENGKLRQVIDFDKLRQVLSADATGEGQERYQFTWPDKRHAIRLANTPTTDTLRPCREESVDFDNTQNLYIEGDNLEVLKLLRESYLGKVKMIYIDPPYNTGGDFVYKDNFIKKNSDYAEVSGAYDEEGNQVVDAFEKNADSNGRFHTDWLNMIYPRLKVARDLLTEDGVIFISIDDNEVENLKKVCDEIFGGSNFVNTIAWVSNITGRQISGYGAAKTWENILVYAKNVNYLETFRVSVGFAKNNMPDAYKGFDKDIRKDEIGEFAVGDTLYNHNRKFNEETRKNLVFSIFYNPTTGEIVPGEIGEIKEGFIELLPHANGDGVHKYHAWRWSKQKISNESYNLIVLPTRNGYEIYTRIRDFANTNLKDLITNIPNGDSEVQCLFGGKKYFDYPKSINLLRTLLDIDTDKEKIVLDFFSGSGTSAHAVMQLNAEDNGHRKYICVQLPEETPDDSPARKAGYATIPEIAKERIRRAAKKVKEEHPDWHGDTGFRVLKLDSSNMENVYYTPAETTELTLFSDNIKSDRTGEDLLFQVMMELGIAPSSKIEKTVLAGKTVWNVDNGYLLACFEPNVTEATITAIVKQQPLYFVMADRSLASDNVADNFEQLFEEYSPTTVRNIL
jgi:adenine-specific DNA-methyltransferase